MTDEVFVDSHYREAVGELEVLFEGEQDAEPADLMGPASGIVAKHKAECEAATKH